MTTPTPITDADLAELERLEKAATPGPWHQISSPWGDGSWVSTGNGDPHSGAMICDCESVAGERDVAREAGHTDLSDAQDDSAFIAAARTELPSLVHRLRTSEAERAHLSSALMSLQSNRDAIEESLRETITTLRARAEKAEAEVARLVANERDAVTRALQLYAESYKTMARLYPDDPRVGCISVATDIENNMVASVLRSLAASRAAPAGQSSAQPAAKDPAANVRRSPALSPTSSSTAR